MRTNFYLRPLLLLWLLSALAFMATPARADTPPPLADILNATQLDVWSNLEIPRPNEARTLVVRKEMAIRQTFQTGSEVTRIARIAIWFAGWTETWTPDKSLVLTLYDGSDTKTPLARAVEPYSRRHWESAVHIFQLDEPAEPHHTYAFEITMKGGVEGLHGLGLAKGPPAEGVGPLTQGDRSLPGALWFETHVKRRADWDLLYQQVFVHFDLSRADMAQVRSAVLAGNWQEAKRTLVAHFESRKDLFPDPNPPAKPPRPIPAKSDAQSEADYAVDHKVKATEDIVDLGPRWNHLASWRTRGGVGLTRSGLRGFLANAYAQTQDEKYAKAWDAMLRFQFDDLPSPLRAGVIAPNAQDITPVGEPGIGGGSMWSSLSIGARMSHGFAYYKAFLHSPNFTLDTRFAFLVNLAEMSDVLEKMKGGGNWEAQNTTALFGFAEMFPEFLKARLWRARGFAGALQNCLENTYPDGPLREATVNYHNLSLNRYMEMLEAAQKQKTPGLEVKPDVLSRVEKMCEYVMYSTMPNGQLPRWGDSNPPSDGASLLKRGAALFGRPDMEWVATAGKQGEPPLQTSVAFPDAGYYLMRSAWSPKAGFLAVHNGRSSAHGHFDANSLVLTAFGQELLIDPGIYIYGTAEAQLLTRSVSHNTVTMDSRNTLNEKGVSHFTTGRLMDVYEGTNAGYEGAKSGDSKAKHRRRVVFIKPSLFLVADDVSGADPHDWTLRFRFAPGKVETEAEGQKTRLTYRAGSPQSASSVGMRIWSAEDSRTAEARSPLVIANAKSAAGWEKLVETPVMSWTRTQATQAHWATLFRPFEAARPAETWQVIQDPHGAAAAIRNDRDIRERIAVKAQGGALADADLSRQSGIETDAEVAYLRAERGAGQEAGTVPRAIRRLAVTNASRLSWQPSAENGFSAATTWPETLLLAMRPITQLEATWEGDTLHLHITGGEGVRIRAYGAQWYSVNAGQRTAVPQGAEWITLPANPKN